MSWWGSWDRKPMVSTYRTVMRLGNWPAWTVTSRVAKSWSLGWRPASPVRALMRVVFPGQTSCKPALILLSVTTRVIWCSRAMKPEIKYFPCDSPQLVYPMTETEVTHHSWCIPWQRRRGSLCFCAGSGGGASSASGAPESHGSSVLSLSEAFAEPPLLSHLNLWNVRKRRLCMWLKQPKYRDTYYYEALNAAVVPEPMIYLEPPPCWSRFATSFFKRDLQNQMLLLKRSSGKFQLFLNKLTHIIQGKPKVCNNQTQGSTFDVSVEYDWNKHCDYLI